MAWIELTAGALVVATSLRLAHLVRKDGLGHRPPPRAERDWAEGTWAQDVR